MATLKSPQGSDSGIAQASLGLAGLCSALQGTPCLLKADIHPHQNCSLVALSSLFPSTIQLTINNNSHNFTTTTQPSSTTQSNNPQFLHNNFTINLLNIH
ncbi:hypothetical protein Scep_027541 [Stephania cephalantha]|uniref:Uncharacterized protein n=1 Tax=Stephania cephalantha TaxID=152367 RepID=A0AAP0E8A1_9MAGN